MFIAAFVGGAIGSVIGCIAGAFLVILAVKDDEDDE